MKGSRTIPTDRGTQSAKRSRPRILLKGIDTLKVYAAGSLSPTLGSALRDARARQHQPLEEHGELKPEKIALAGMVFALCSVPRRNTPFVLGADAEGIEIAVSPLSIRNKNTFIMIRLGARRCVGADPSSLVALLRRIVADCFVTVARVHVSEMDIHCDWLGWRPPMESPELWSRRGVSMEYGMCRSRRSVSSIAFGYKEDKPRGKIALRLENKSNEIRTHSQKFWLYDLYRQVEPALTSSENIYRLEVRLQRDALAKMKSPDGNSLGDEGLLDTVEQTLRNVPAIWRKVLADTRLVVPGAAKQRTRWKTDPAWEVLSEAFGCGPSVTRTQVTAAQVVGAEAVCRAYDAKAARAVQLAAAAQLLSRGTDLSTVSDDVLKSMMQDTAVHASPDRERLARDMRIVQERGAMPPTVLNGTLSTPVSDVVLEDF